MFSDAKWSRFVGERGRPGMEGPPPEELHMVPANFTHRQAVGVPTPITSPGLGGSLTVLVDPPVGGIVFGSTLGVVARDGPSLIIIAAGAPPSPNFFFAPGVYAWSGWMSGGNIIGAQNNPVGLAFAGRQSNGIIIPGLVPLPGAPNAWRQELYPGSPVAPYQHTFQGEMYIPGEWTAFFYTPNGLGDNDVYYLHVDIWPLYVFDEAGAT